MKKISLLIILALAMSISVYANGGSEEEKMEGQAMEKSMAQDSVLVVLDAGKSSRNVKYIYGALNAGLKAAGQTEEVTIDFIATADVDASVFDTYDAIIAFNENTTDALSDSIGTFVNDYKSKSNLIVVAVIQGKSSLDSNPAGIDVLSSASTEEDAGALVYGTVAPKVKALF